MEINGDNSKIPRNWAQKWTKEEDERLLSAISLYDQDWKKIAEAVGTRNVCMYTSYLFLVIISFKVLLLFSA